jgi:ABC-type multidrug transport system fused ATPase/permease subunit
LVLKDFTAQAYRGQTLALVGPSGCGKSTIIQLLERYYDVLSGSVKIDDTDIREINIKHLRANMALVGQEPTLFSMSIEENISYGMKDVTEAQVIEAAKLANIHSFVESLPKVCLRVFNQLILLSEIQNTDWSSCNPAFWWTETGTLVLITHKLRGVLEDCYSPCSHSKS